MAYGSRRPPSDDVGFKFNYRRPTKETLLEHASRRINDFDSMYNIPVRNFKVKLGENLVRFLPQKEELQADHYTQDIFVHRDVGPDSARYLCRHAMLRQRCIVCDERTALMREGDTSGADQLKSQPRAITWVINRDDQDAGPLIWEMSPTQVREISALQVNRRTGETILADDPDSGYDLQFTGEEATLKVRGQTVKYAKCLGWQFVRTATPLSDDPELYEQWLKHVMDNPLPDILKFYDNEYIENIIFPSTGKEEKVVEEQPVRRAVPRYEEEVKPKVSVKEDLDDEIPPFDPETGEIEEEEEKPRPQARGNGGSRPRVSRAAEPEEDEEGEAPPDEDQSAQLRDRLRRMQENRRP